MLSPSPADPTHPVASFPTLSTNALADAHFYEGIDAYVSDHYPWRATALSLTASLQYRIFGMSGNPLVIPGRNGWLFLQGEVFPTCLHDAEEVITQIATLSNTLGQLGRPLRFVVAPDKRTIYRSMLPAALQTTQTCTDVARPEIRAAATGNATVVDLWGPVEEAVTPPEQLPIYWPQDTHWAPAGATAGIRALVESLGVVWESSAVQTDSEAAYNTGDLMRLMGLQDVEYAASIEIRRAGQTIVRVDAPSVGSPGEELMEFRTQGEIPVVKGRTLIVYDSFFGPLWHLIAPWFEDSVFVHVDQLACPETVAAVPDFDRVIVERAERSAYNYDYPAIFAPLIGRMQGYEDVRPAEELLGHCQSSSK